MILRYTAFTVMNKYSRFLFGLCGLLALVGLAGSAAAAGSGVSGAVSQSYNAGPSVLPGMIIELKSKDPRTVVPLLSKDIHSMFGVVVPANDAAIVLTPKSASAQQVLVATSGSYGLLVSNEGGPIKAGDYLAVSSLAGIAMKAGVSQAEIVGQAAGDFSGSSNVIGSVKIKNSLGRTTTVAIGHITANVHLAANPLFQKNADGFYGLLNRLTNSDTNDPLKLARIGLSAFVLLSTLLITVSILYGGVRNGLISIGRNPLAKKAIGRGVVWSMAAGLIVFAVGVFAAYLILRL